MPVVLERVAETARVVMSLLLSRKVSDPARLYTFLSWLLANKSDDYPELTTGSSGGVCLDLFTSPHAIMTFTNSYFCLPTSAGTAAIGLSKRILTSLAVNRAAASFLSDEGKKSMASEHLHQYTLLLHSRGLNNEIKTRARAGPTQSLRYLAAPVDDTECIERWCYCANTFEPDTTVSHIHANLVWIKP